jgi:hypothetical protein
VTPVFAAGAGSLVASTLALASAAERPTVASAKQHGMIQLKFLGNGMKMFRMGRISIHRRRRRQKDSASDDFTRPWSP